MTAIDAFGYPVAGCDEARIKDWDRAVHAYLAHDRSLPEKLGALFAAQPHFAMALACKGLFSLLLGRRELISVAKEAHEAAERALIVGSSTERERRYVEALGLYVAHQPSRAAAAFDALLQKWPRDALALKIGHSIKFVLGDPAGMRSSIEAVIDHYNQAHPAAGYAYGCYAFALEETGEYLKAEEQGRLSQSLARDDAWGLHAVAHVLEMTGRPRDGIDWIAAGSPMLKESNNFGYHVWWHLALFHLELGHFETALKLYDRKVRKEQTDDFRDISNGTALLARLEIEGVDVGDRWEEMGALSASRIEDGCNIFADVHYLLARGRPGRMAAAEQLVRHMRSRQGPLAGELGGVAARAGMPLALGILAYGRGEFASAQRHLAEAARSFQCIGGSHAQRDVFAWLAVDAAIKAQRPTAARSLIQQRLHLRAPDSFTRRRLPQVEALEQSKQLAATA